MATKILSVGNCAADNYSLSRMLSDSFQADVIEASDRVSALESTNTGSIDLILVNRILDATGENGVDLVPEILGVDPKAKVMLVSNFDDAQQKAVDHGALPGFGKSKLSSPETIEKIAAAISG